MLQYVLLCDVNTRINNMQTRYFADRSVRVILLVMALTSTLVVLLIGLFTLLESLEAFQDIGLANLLLEGNAWRPGQDMYGIQSMVAGTLLTTLGAILLGVPLSLSVATFLAEIATPTIRNIVRPAVELLAGIPSVIYGLFGMVVIVPLIRETFPPASRTGGYSLLAASIVLAVMIGPTVTNLAEEALRAVPCEYKHGSLALGATHWQTITRVTFPAARSGIIAAIILGIGRAVGETMAMIMVIGNAIVMPAPLTDNPLSIIFSQARTLTGNIAVEINYATGVHRSALFATGVILFIMIMLINSSARMLLRKRKI